MARMIRAARKMGMFTPRYVGMMGLEQDLPHLPLPPLQQTMDKYLKAVRPLVDDPEYEVTQKAVEEFRKKGGIGETLQEKLIERHRTKDNWLVEIWDNYAFYYPRVSLVANLSPGVAFPMEHFEDKLDYLRYSARLISSVLKFRHAADNNYLSIDMDKLNTPFNMYQYKQFLCSCRVPGIEKDELHVGPPGEAKNIIVVHRNQFYSFDVYDANGMPLGDNDIMSQLMRIVNNTEQAEPPVGALTTENRTVWARERIEMIKDPTNKANLELIEKSVTMLCLDKPPLPSTEAMCLLEHQEDSKSARMALTGEGTHHNTLNRWFDKQVQFFVTETGHLASCYEHTCAEGTTIARMWDFCLSESKDYKYIVPSDLPSSLPAPAKLKWNLTKSNLEAIEIAKHNVDEIVRDVDMRILVYTNYGKEYIKSQGLSPDSWIQLAFQLTFYRIHGHMPPTYETGRHRKYKFGRTDTIRTPSSAAQEFVQAMTNKHTTNPERRNMMRNALSAHAHYTNEVHNGRGIDRHLLALKVMAIEAGIPLPDIFTDETFDYAFHFQVSTSQVPFDHEATVVFGAGIPDAYGICYNPHPHKMLFSMMTYKSCPDTNPGLYAAGFQQSLDEMQRLSNAAKL